MPKFFRLLAAAISLYVSTALAHQTLTPTRFIDVDGTSVAIYESKGKKGPGILLVHGNTTSANAFTDIMKSGFAKKYRVVAFDMPGYGLSENAASYSAGSLANSIVEVAEATGTDDGVIFGWSLGGDLALQAS